MEDGSSYEVQHLPYCRKQALTLCCELRKRLKILKYECSGGERPMRNEHTSVSFIWRPLLLSILVMLMGTGLILSSQDLQAKSPYKRRSPERRAANALQGNRYIIGETVTMTGTCVGTINFPDIGLSGDTDATLLFQGDRFTITAGAVTRGGRLSVRARSKNLISTSVNLTFDQPIGQTDADRIFTVSLRGCQDLDDEHCDKPSKGGRIERRGLFTLKSAEGDSGHPFSFISPSCVEVR